MSTNNSPKKYKKPKQKTFSTTNPGAPSSPNKYRDNEDRSECLEQKVCLLQAKDSEWVDIMKNPSSIIEPSTSGIGDDEAILQLVDCEDGPESEPLTIMFPGLLQQDPRTLESMLTRNMSTTEVTRQLVDLGIKANLEFMKKSKLIPRDKQWLEKVPEFDNTDSFDSAMGSQEYVYKFWKGPSSEYEADTENAEDEETVNIPKKKKKILLRQRKRIPNHSKGEGKSPCTLTPSSSRSNCSVEKFIKWE